MVSLSRSNMVTTLAVFVLLLACSICSGVAAASVAYILEDGAGNVTYPCRGIGGECLSDVEELEFVEVQFSQHYSSSNWRLMPIYKPQGGQSQTRNTSNAGQPACGLMPGGQYKCCMTGETAIAIISSVNKISLYPTCCCCVFPCILSNGICM